jgi:hypothetical protein
MSTALYYLATRFGDVWGTSLYENYGGFEVCVAMTVVVYAAILPILWLVPKSLTATADGEVAAPNCGDDKSALSMGSGKS